MSLYVIEETLAIKQRFLGGSVEQAQRPWLCSICRVPSGWTSEHAWYGASLDIDGETVRRPARAIVVTCSAGCREIAAVSNLVPDDASWL